MSLMSSSIPLTIYRADPSFLNALTFDKLKQFAFRPIDNLPEKKGWGFTNFDDMFDVGWTKSVPEKGQYFTFGFRIDSRTVPPSIIKKHYAEMEAEELERIKAGGKKFLSRERKKELRVLCKSRLLSRTEPRPAMYGVAVNIKTGLVYVACVSKTVLELLESYLKAAFSSVPERIFPDTLSTLASEHPFEEFLRDLYIESMMLSLNAHKYHVAEQGKATLAQENGPSVSVNDAPDVLLLPATFLAIPAGALVLGHGWLATLSGCLLGGGSFWLLSDLYRRFRGRDGLGLGDAKLMALLGALAGPLALPSIVLMASLSALTFNLIARHAASDSLPFGPWLSAGFFLHTLLPRILP